MRGQRKLSCGRVSICHATQTSALCRLRHSSNRRPTYDTHTGAWAEQYHSRRTRDRCLRCSKGHTVGGQIRYPLLSPCVYPFISFYTLLRPYPPLLLPVPSSTPPPCSCSKCVVSGTSTGTVHDDGCSRHLQCVVTGVYGALSLSLLQVPRAGNPRRGRGLHDRPRRRNAAPTRAVSGRTPALRDLGTGEGGRGEG